MGDDDALFLLPGPIEARQQQQQIHRMTQTRGRRPDQGRIGQTFIEYKPSTFCTFLPRGTNSNIYARHKKRPECNWRFLFFCAWASFCLHFLFASLVSKAMRNQVQHVAILMLLPFEKLPHSTFFVLLSLLRRQRRWPCDVILVAFIVLGFFLSVQTTTGSSGRQQQFQG
jgi:hypothetical protein